MNFLSFTVILATFGYWASSKTKTALGISWVERGIALALGGIAILCTAFPLQTAQPMAEWFGIGRGVDFVIYTYVLFSLLLIHSLYRRIKSNSYQLTILMQEIALINKELFGAK